MRKSISIAVAAAFLLSTVLVAKPARAEGGAIALAIIAGVVTVASIQCTSKRGEDTITSLCWLSPLGWIQTASAATGTITVEPTKKKKKKK